MRLRMHHENDNTFNLSTECSSYIEGLHPFAGMSAKKMNRSTKKSFEIIKNGKINCSKRNNFYSYFGDIKSDLSFTDNEAHKQNGVQRSDKKEVDISLAVTFLKTKATFLNVEGVLYCFNGKIFENISDVNVAISCYKKILNEEHLRLISDYKQLHSHLLSDSELYVKSIADLPRNRDAIVFENGTFYVSKRKFREGEFSIKDYAFSYIKTNYDPYDNNGKAVVDNFLDYFSNNMQRRVRLFCEIVGVAISNYNPKQSIVLFLGAPDAGKSTVLNFVELILGSDLYSSLPLDELLANYAMSELVGVKVVADDDVAYNKALTTKQVARLKVIAGSGKMRARQIYQSAVQFRPEVTYLLASNGMLKFPAGEDIEALMNRFIIFPLEVSIDKENQDPYILDKLYAGRNYMIKLALDALADLIERNFEYSLEDNIEKYYENTVIDYGICKFIDDCCILDSAAIVSSSELYKEYCRYIEINDIDNSCAINIFVPYLCNNYGIRKVQTEKKRLLKGICLGNAEKL